MLCSTAISCSDKVGRSIRCGISRGRTYVGSYRLEVTDIGLLEDPTIPSNLGSQDLFSCFCFVLYLNPWGHAPRRLVGKRTRLTGGVDRG